MKTSLAFLILAVGCAAPALARPVDRLSLGELWSRADLVVVLAPTNTVKTADQFPQAGEPVRIERPEKYQGFNTTCHVEAVFKRAGAATNFNARSLTLLHFGYARPQLPFNGAFFIYFELPPAWHVVTVAHTVVSGRSSTSRVDPMWIGTSDRPTYLAFLRRREDGRFEPVTGHYDAALSFRVMAELEVSNMVHNMRALETNAPPAAESAPR
jgi:hypothetical protein